MTASVVFDLNRVDQNLAKIRRFEEALDGRCKVLYALKACYGILPYLGRPNGLGLTLIGEVSSVGEAILSERFLSPKSHAFLVSITDDEWNELEKLVSHVSFNTLNYGDRYAKRAESKGILAGIRVNPRHSVSSYEDYDPCRRGCRFGLDIGEIPRPLPSWISGLHIHALCENGAAEFKEVLNAFESGVADLLPSLSWVNLGGGFLATCDDFEEELFISTLKGFAERYPNLKIYLEPGAAWVWESAVLESTITDIIVRSGIKTAITDFSFRAHLSDFLIGSQMMDFPIDIDGLTFVPKAERNKYDEEKLYVIGGSSCAMIDRRGAYISDRELQVGDTLVMRNMGHYVDVTFSWFNGIIPPNIVYRRELPDGSISEERITNRKASHVLEIFGLGSNR